MSLIYEDQWIANANFNLWTDASGTGFGPYWDSAYLLGEFTKWACSQSITFKELYAIIAAVATWGLSWSGKKIRIYYDNKSICQILQHQNSWSTPVAALLQTLYHLSVKFGCLISAMHLLGVDNPWTDCLSRGWLEKFYAICPSAAPFPTTIGNFALDFSDEAGSRTRSPHCDLAMNITRRLYKEGVCGRTMALPGADGHHAALDHLQRMALRSSEPRLLRGQVIATLPGTAGRAEHFPSVVGLPIRTSGKERT